MEISESSLGARHPQSLFIRKNRASLFSKQERVQDALAEEEKLLELTGSPDLVRLRAPVELSVGASLLKVGRPADAVGHLVRATALFTGLSGAQARDAVEARALLCLARARSRREMDAKSCEEMLADARVLGPEHPLVLASGLLSVSEMRLTRGQLKGTAALLSEAMALRSAAHHPVEAGDLSHAKFLLARLTVAEHGPRSKAVRLARTALEGTTGHPSLRALREEISTWLEGHPSPR